MGLNVGGVTVVGYCEEYLVNWFVDAVDGRRDREVTVLHLRVCS